MPVRPIYRINPQDHNRPFMNASYLKALGINILFNGKNVFESTITTRENTKAQLINFVLTNKGERLMDPNFGGNVRAMIFDPTTNADSIIATLEQDIAEYIPNVVVEDISLTTNPDAYEASLTITYSIFNQSNTLNINITQ